ncbi:DUF3891 family protein [Salirhabdus salicampi]|uniref:DUF3891 family protein n=1 Tax=Salirhabdus salicampi TaxID=476102 RepID=UPI0020C2067D|nr:DUF3891 family protein [Salirhabdus salicampi]MCP8617177.1 DUF3891 family protein [Salirhabdus salicampi]
MIVVENEHYFQLIKQHEHGIISGEIANHLLHPFFIDNEHTVKYAIKHHDIAWDKIDEYPKWNEERMKPYSFIDYPTNKKVGFYQQGISLVESSYPYAGLLCSLHYVSFFSMNDDEKHVQTFLKNEFNRRQRILEQVKVSEKRVELHKRTLQFCDDLSLYICMNKPGVSKEEELSWFREGFQQRFSFMEDKIHGHWRDKKHVVIDPFPFKTNFTVSIPFKRVKKTDILKEGFVKAEKKAEQERRDVSFVPC